MNEITSLIFARLVSIGLTVFDHVPQGQAHPFVRVDPLKVEVSDTDTERGFEAKIQIVTYSRYRGAKECQTIAQQIYDALHLWQPANTANYRIIVITQDFQESAIDDDGLTRYTIQRFKIIFDKL